MERDHIDKTELVTSLSEFEMIACRICLENNGEDWEVTHLIGDLNSSNPTESGSDVFPYTNVAFIRDVVPIEEFCSWIHDSKGMVGGLSFALPETHSQIQRER